eukprot:TRINITY_DN14111_c0_g1_i1.p1 TRINITY_DN14111_c0_g1~~TRINITY_DN14111_c0_g1_i1.p1  ORF type:complete len:3881 (+),score=986.19 TRINITY_DN14111_c0_g1_i1:27-11669(+)
MLRSSDPRLAMSTEPTGRSLLVSGGNVELVLHVHSELWSTALLIRDDFNLKLKNSREESQGEDLNEFELLLLFAKHVLSYLPLDREDFPVLLFLKQLFANLHGNYLKGADPHVHIEEKLSTMPVSDALRIYYNILVKLEDSGAFSEKEQEKVHVRPALFEEVAAGKAKLLAVFGGQGLTEDLLEELLELDNAYSAFTRPFLQAVAPSMRRAAEQPEAHEYTTKGFDILRWIEKPETRPPRDYLFSAAVSLPLVGLVQLLNYFVTVKILKITPGEFRDKFVSVAGHSQGVVSAVVISKSSTHEEFIANSIKALQMLFWIGLRSQQVFPETTLSPKILSDSLDHDEGIPMPMLAVSNLALPELQNQIDISNKFLRDGQKIEVSLLNGPRTIVCSGPPKSLYGLNLLLRKLKAPATGDQSKIPFSERKVRFSTKFLPISSPFHCSYLEAAVDLVLEDVKRNSLAFNDAPLAIPVIRTDTRKPLENDEELTRALVVQICIEKVHWVETIRSVSFTHLLDFGPGRVSGIGALIHKNMDGMGIQVVLAGTTETPSQVLQSRRHFFSSHPTSVRYGKNWGEKYKPRLVKNLADGKTYLDTKFSRLLGKQPLMVAGMTPTTADADFVAACMNAGYFVELSGGAHFSEPLLRNKIDQVLERVSPGSVISLNVLFINQRQWGFQYPLAQTLRKEGVPIEGFTIAAGVPSLEVANEILKSLNEAGINHVSFKPGSVEGIRQVITIAKSNPEFPIILQWTGGRAGGHHSFEDFHQPILETYSAIRSCENICLVGGSGFGDGEETFPYLSGTWSLAYDYPVMPFDGLLLGSRLLVAKEGRTSLSVKNAIVEAAGIENEKDWVQSYKTPVGGIVTVISELGEPIHKVATRGVLLWKELDEKVFSLPRDKRLPYLQANKTWIIERLNRDFQKVWFGKKEDGTVAELNEMTYYEVAYRLAELLYIKHQDRWIDRSHKVLFLSFLLRVEERSVKSSCPSVLPTPCKLQNPWELLESFFKACPFLRNKLMCSEDCLHFVALCRTPRQKPVPFVPVFDENFETWFKKDSLWQSEDVDAVVDQDPQRVCILQGPVAVRHSKKANETTKEILDGIVGHHMSTLLQTDYSSEESQIPTVAWFGGIPASKPVSLRNVPGVTQEVVEEDKEKVTTFSIPDTESELPDNEAWIALLSGTELNWVRALLASKVILQGKKIVTNLIRTLFRPRAGISGVVRADANGKISEVSIRDSYTRVIAKKFTAEKKITVELISDRASLSLEFGYNPANSLFPIEEKMQGRNERIKQFYWKTWFQDSENYEDAASADPVTSVFTCNGEVTANSVARFCRIVGNFASAYTKQSEQGHLAPMDYAIVVSWKAVIKCLFPSSIDGDLLNLVHLSNAVRYLDNTNPLTVGDQIESKASIQSIKWLPTGKVVEVIADILKDGTPILQVVSKFLFRGTPPVTDLFFENGKEVFKKIVTSDEQLAVLKHKKWISWNDELTEKHLKEKSELVFHVQYHHESHSDQKSLKKVECSGFVLIKTEAKEYIRCGEVKFYSTQTEGGLLKANPVLEYLGKNNNPFDAPVLFEGDGHPLVQDNHQLSITTSSSNYSYSDVSGDHNPIHTNPFFADLAGLPGTITHGMWTSSAVRALVETYAGDNQPLRVTEYDVSFTGMVLPTEQLTIKLQHIGMKNGNKLVKVETYNTNGEKILDGTAVVEQPRTAYVFTGQGSQEAGMGMDLYTSSKVAKAIWDRADEHFFLKFGFSIIDIVKNNPKSLTVYFGGPRGKEVRDNYLSMSYESVDSDGPLPLFPSITSSSASYTFNSPNGLLFATQFAQPALTLMEKAAYEDMCANGLVNPHSPFAGHSLGEYAALSSIGDVLSIETLCDIVFYRGMTMQVAVKRDESGRSQYGMVAVNPTRVSPTFDDKLLRRLIVIIGDVSQLLIEIVNYNVENWQYVVAGDITALDALSSVLNYVHVKKFDMVEVIHKYGEEKVAEVLKTIVQEALIKSKQQVAETKQPLTLTRGIATIPLAGIDVPFHSAFLRGGVPTFRKCLQSGVRTSAVDISILKGHYIPNLTGLPFDVSRDYLEIVLKSSGSPIIKEILDTWTDDNQYDSAEKKQELARVILIELLAFQFASPVRWITTQDQLFRHLDIQRIIEIGPSPVLCNMAERTLKIKYQEHDDALNNTRSIWCYSRNKQEIYYQEEPAIASSSQASSSPAPAAAPQVVAAAPVAATASVARTASKSYDTLPLEAEEMLQVIIGLKIKKPVSEIPSSKSIKDLSGGKSTLQNEILADLQKEFGDNVPERSEEISIKDLAAHIRPTFTKSPGKHTSSLIARMFSSKMPAGFTGSTAKDILASEFGLSAKASDSLFMYCLAFEPATRLANEEAAKGWLRSTTVNFFETHGLELPSSGGSSGGGDSTVVVSSAELEKLQAKQKQFQRQQMELIASYIDQNLLEFHEAAVDKSNQVIELQKDLDLWLVEHGQVYADGVKPLFSWIKTRKYDSYWNWACQDAFLLYYDIIFGRLKNVDRNVTTKCLHVMNRSFQHLVDFMEYHIFKSPEMTGIDGSIMEQKLLARQYGTMLIDEVRQSMARPPLYKDVSFHTRPSVTISANGTIKYEEVRRVGVNSFEAYVQELKKGSTLLQSQGPNGEPLPYVYIRERSADDPAIWTFSEEKTAAYLGSLDQMATSGVSFEGKTALMTGCGKGSIGSEILKGLLSGGAKVIVTTSSFNRNTVDYFRGIYENHGARSSALVVAPFNQGSSQDIEALISYIYSTDPNKGLGWDLDYVIPFAAISENGREVTDIDSKSELAHRIMLTNVLRMIGHVATQKKQNRIETRPAQVVLPLSPNHGIFGGDGLYGESKIGLEALMNRWHSESWSSCLTIAGAVIGWTRGTGLMNDNNLIAEDIEKLGVRTFSSSEMAFNILGMMHPTMVDMSEVGPVYGDLNGGMGLIRKLNEVAQEIRGNITEKARIRRALAEDDLSETLLLVDQPPAPRMVNPRANLKSDYPKPPTAEKVNTKLRDLLDLASVVVVTGYGEVGPWGSSRTRWQIEAEGELSLEACIEMAWMMGFIKFQSGTNSAGQPFSSWVDIESGAPVQDIDIKEKYEEKIISHSGIRFVEPELFGGYDPSKKMLTQEIAINYDMAPIVVSKEEAEAFKLQHGASVDAYENEAGSWNVKFKRGATIYVPKALRFDRLVAGQIPTGWSAERYGVPKDIVDQVDPVTLYTIVSTVEALVASGITDPYEFYQYVHVSEVGNTSGGGEGGLLSNQKMFKHRLLDKPVPSDILQETFINTMPAWVNLLLLSSAGPIKTPVGACATAVESVEIGVDTILSGKARVVVVGGYDDFQEESAFEFASMKATSNTVEEMQKGRLPNEMSRPATTSRAGFMEAQGAGIQVLMSAELAIRMGCPIYGIVALTNTATDKEGRSVPAPGQGILTTAKSIRGGSTTRPRILDAEYRNTQLQKSLKQIKSWFQEEVQELDAEAQTIADASEREAFVSSRSKDIEIEASMRERTERRLWGSDFWRQDPRISPIEGALSVFGLTIDDINVASFHGTGTKANDLNESEVVNRQLEHLGRTKGNLLPAIFQKYLTGHPKGAAAAWMLNGMLQVLNTGIIPGNRNADNIDESLSKFSFLLYPSRTVKTTGLRAGLLKSFGFGQVGGEVLVIHPDYVYSALTEEQFNSYMQKRNIREQKTYQYLHDAMMGIAPLVQVKTAPPYSHDLESKVYLNPLARASFDSKSKSWSFDKASVDNATEELYSKGLIAATGTLGGSAPLGIGVDVQLIMDINAANQNFVERNFTQKEQEYASVQPSPQNSFAGRWAAKEAVLKALCNAYGEKKPTWLQGPGGSLNLIEVLPSSSGAPVVRLHDDLKQEEDRFNIKVGISHSGSYAIAFATVTEK